MDNKYFFDIKDIIVDIGEGIALAQQKLDEQAVNVQKEINKKPELRNTGMTATWYSMPETTFSLKINYAVKKESSEKNQKRKHKFLLSPINAKYQNLFSTSLSSQSDFKIKFVPVPPPPAISQKIIVPDLRGLTLEEAEELLKRNNLKKDEARLVEGSPEKDQPTEVVEQSPPPGTEVRFEDEINLEYKKEEK